MTAELTEHARAASAMAFALLAVAALVRGVGDVLKTGGSALSWFSPIAWAQQTRTFVELRWWPLLLPLALTVVLVVVAYRLVAIRDVGAGLVRGLPAAGRPGHVGRYQRARGG